MIYQVSALTALAYSMTILAFDDLEAHYRDRRGTANV